MSQKEEEVEEGEGRKCHWCGIEEKSSASCGDTSVSLQQCSRCKHTLYCSRDCQRWDFKSVHKKVCGTFLDSSPPEVRLWYGCINNSNEELVENESVLGFVLMRTREDEIYYHQNVFSPQRGCVYEVLCCVSHPEAVERFPNLVDSLRGDDKAVPQGWVEEPHLESMLWQDYTNHEKQNGQSRTGDDSS